MHNARFLTLEESRVLSTTLFQGGRYISHGHASFFIVCRFRTLQPYFRVLIISRAKVSLVRIPPIAPHVSVVSEPSEVVTPTFFSVDAGY